MGASVTHEDTSGKLVKRRALTAVPETTRLARELVKEACQQWGLQPLTYDASCVISEIVTNAIEASQEMQDELDPPLPVHFGVAKDPKGFIVCWAWDKSPRLPSSKSPGPLEENGRGLQVILGICGEGNFGVEASTGLGKTVWARIPISLKRN